MRWCRPLAALGAVTVLALPACDGGEAEDLGSPGGEVGLDHRSDVRDPERHGPVVIEGAREGGTVHVRDQSLLMTSVDPTEAYHRDTVSLLSGLVVRSLTQYAYDEQSGDVALVPDLATDLGTPNEDYTEWAFTLREGVRYENGDPVTVEDIGFAIDRSFDRATFPTGARYSTEYFLNGDTYEGPYTDKQTDTCGCYEIDGHTITITMARPFPDMPYWGASPAMSAIPRSAADPQTYRQHPLATGPYRFERYTPGESLTLIRNKEWDAATDPGRTQYPHTYDFRTQVPLRVIGRRILSDTGAAQTMMTREDVLAQDYRRLRDEAPERLVLGNAPCTYYVAPDYRAIPDIEVRKAIGYAYPYKAANLASDYIEGVTAIPAGNLMPPGIPGRLAYDPDPDLGDFATDTDQARRLLEESGNLGFEIRFLWRTDSKLDTMVKDVTAKSLSEAGFEVTPMPTTELGYVEARDDVHSDINLRTGGWCSDWSSGSSWLPPLLETTDLEEEGFGANLSAFSEKDVDDRMHKILELPLEEQATAWNDLDRYVSETYYPLITTLYTGVTQAHGSRIGGHFADSVHGQPTWKDIHVIP